ncbi:MAG: NAD-dependent epimerase/dehydratase family protein [Acidobacteriaceae bacterium]|nr:NAD-dependent epimerase/dehydratase family protein [Acidobacteriaceae bacterium]
MTSYTKLNAALTKAQGWPARRWFIAGGAGFIGSHFTDALLANPAVTAVTIFDNFSSGREWHFRHHSGNPALKVVRGDLNDTDRLNAAMTGHDAVIHLASNPDIAKAVKDPDIDFREGTVLTRQVVEAMRLTGARYILYASGSGVYGDAGSLEFREEHGPLVPISTYGASKLAGEALIASYCYMFGLKGCAFRFGNVVGPRQTHGVGFDFVRQLLDHPDELRILGDGSQSKSYIHVEDVVSAVLLAYERSEQPFTVYNVATGDYITVTEIAEIAAGIVGCNGKTKFTYTGGDRGWKGDVPVVRLSTERIRSLGWQCGRNTADAMRASLAALIPEARKELASVR